MQRMLKVIAVASAMLVLSGCSYLMHGPTYPEIPRTTMDELRSLLGQPDITVLDVRDGKDWRASETKIAGARREDPEDVDRWAGTYAPEGRYILY